MAGGFQSRLFTRAELARLVQVRFEVEEIRGRDLFHGRFAKTRAGTSGAAALGAPVAGSGAAGRSGSKPTTTAS